MEHKTKTILMGFDTIDINLDWIPLNKTLDTEQSRQVTIFLVSISLGLDIQ